MPDAPTADQIEINIFGPGYGECCLIHFGGGKWIIIDSCVDDETGQPAALAYLDKIGIDPAESVELVVASHWHDDHVKGLSEVVRRCGAARFCSSAALNQREFVTVLSAYDQNRAIAAGPGSQEMMAVLRLLETRSGLGSSPIAALSNKSLLLVDESKTGHGFPVAVWSLSPSDAQFSEFLREIGELSPKEGGGKVRMTATSPNHLSVVILIAIGPRSFLFGADLEEVSSKPNFGWSAICTNRAWPRSKSMFFKIPHHGSETAEHKPTWELLLEKNPSCVVTPWRRGSTLPKLQDVERLLGYTNRGFSTSNCRPKAMPSRPYPVQKQIRDSRVKLRPVGLKMGHVRIRYCADGTDDPALYLSPEACSLADLRQSIRT
jgi:hypothetical protein